MTIRTAVLTLLVLVAASPAQDPPAPKNLGASEIGTLIEALTSDDAVAREQAVTQLIAAGGQVMPFVESVVARDAGPAVSLAARRVFSAVRGLSFEEARDVRRTLDALRRSDSRSELRTLAQDLVKSGENTVRFALAELERRNQTGSELSRRLIALDAVRALAEGENLEDRASISLRELGAAAIGPLGEFAGDRSLPEAWRTVATERLLFLGGMRAFATALTLSSADHISSVQLALPFVCRHAPPERFVEVAIAVYPTVHKYPGLGAPLQILAERMPKKGLLSHLRNKLPDARGLAARLLGMRREKEAREGLRRLLTDRHQRVAIDAVRSLGVVGDQDDLGALVQLLKHDKATVRRECVRAVARLQGREALPWLAAALRDSDASVRAAAARAMGDTRDEESLAVLVESLGDGEPIVVAAATESLAAITGDRASTTLVGSSSKELENIEKHWRNWFYQRQREAEERQSDQAEADATDATEAMAEEGNAVGSLALEGGRILAQMAEVLRSQFRPYGELKDRDGTSPQNLLKAAIGGMQEILTLKEDPDEPEQLSLEMEDEPRSVLLHLLNHARFRSVEDLARMTGSLPMPLSERDYMLLVHHAVERMVASLGDRFTRLEMTEDAAGKVDPDALPSLFGKGKTLGLMTSKTDAGLEVEFVMALSVAERAGLRPGDKIISVNGKLADQMSSGELRRALEDEVQFSVLRDGWTRPVAFTLAAAEIDPDSLVQIAMLPGEIGYLRLREFDLGCAQKIEWGLRELEKQGARALVFDLRNNPGGTVLDAVAIVDKFVPGGRVITTQWTNSSDPDEDHFEQIMRSTDSSTDRDYPLAVLISKCSASASEMTSGALQDLDRAVVVGQTSWGKGIGQSFGGVTGFPRRSVFGETRGTFSLRITILEYFLPGDRSIQGVGVEPDTTVRVHSLLGERFELMDRVRRHPATREFVEKLIADDPEHAAALARFDSWDPSEYDGFAELRGKLRVELSAELTRSAVRSVLREKLVGAHPEFAVVDVQDDDDVRSAVAELAGPLKLDLGAFPEYEDLED